MVDIFATAEQALITRQELPAPFGANKMRPRHDWVCYQSSTGEKWAPNAGVHGGLSRAEMLIPFLAYRF